MKKTRFNLTTYYSVTDILGKQIAFSAADGIFKTDSHPDVIPIQSNETNIIKEAKTIGSSCTSRGSITKIISYNSGNDTYRVKFEMPGDNKACYDTNKSKELLHYQPLLYSNLELEFFERQSTNRHKWLFIQLHHHPNYILFLLILW
ncbi:MAG: hypothetical protein Ta2E_01800 [Mycoplasmoidaceae bacterium]|nr:MAG: hypothetical protein Ta2E_01800 [Mycoplasmoidaceae bacterium]